MKTLWVRNGLSLWPADEDAGKYFRKIGQGEMVQCEIKRPRNVHMHRKFFALCAFVAEHASSETRQYTAYQIAKLLEIRTGHCDPIHTTQGIVMIPRDINFSAMDDEEFERLFNDCLLYVSESILPTIDEPTIRRELEKFISGNTSLQ